MMPWDIRVQAFEIFWEKRRNAVYKHFFHFSEIFSTPFTNKSPFLSHIFSGSANGINLHKSKVLSFTKRLIQFQ